jgi:hypothetical protein
MVSIETNAIVYLVFSCVVAVLGFFIARTFANYDERFKILTERLNDVVVRLEHLIGEHEAIKEQCLKRRRK